jgi:tripartite ATP-independent transporter DctP family solute receptor
VTTMTRRRFVGAASAATAVPLVYVSTGYAAQFNLKYANNVPLTHPLNIHIGAAAERIKEETNGAVAIEIFPNNQLGGDTDMFSQLRAGGIDLFSLSGLIVATAVPAASINGVGFAWKNYDDVWKAMDGDLGAYIRAQMAKANIHAFEKPFDNGYRQITSSTKPILTPDDLKGFKIRVPVSPLWTSMFKAFGAAPTGINFSETYSALQTKVVEGQENPLSIIKIGKLYEVQKYCSLTNHMWDGFWFMANKKNFEAIPDEIRAVMTKHFQRAAFDQRAQTLQLNNSLQAEIEKDGMQFFKTDPEPFRQTLIKAGFYKEWQGKFGDEAWALLEKATGKLG